VVKKRRSVTNGAFVYGMIALGVAVLIAAAVVVIFLVRRRKKNIEPKT
jgi:hypothetical protein